MIPHNLNPFGFIQSEEMPLTLIAVEDNSAVKLTATGSPTVSGLQYRVKGGSWTSYTIDDVISLDNVDDYVQFQNTADTLSNSNVNYCKFVMTGKINASGNVQSLLNYSDSVPDNSFISLFNGCTSLLTAPLLPAKILGASCYNSMFAGCSNLTRAPELPALTVPTQAYESMFHGCTSLVTAPLIKANTFSNYACVNMFRDCTSLVNVCDLSATNLSISCYGGMFRGCTSLVNAPALSATTMKQTCYNNMFNGCTSLVTAPELPAMTLAAGCYQEMFQNCASLSSAPILSSTTLASNCYQSMFTGCTSLKEAPELPASILSAGTEYRAMFQNCTSLTQAPELPASSLTSYCYSAMFQNCTSLTGVPILSATTLASYCYTGMFQGCTKLEKGPKIFATSIPSSATNALQNMFYNCQKLVDLDVDFTSWDNSASSGWLYNTALNTSGEFYCPAELVLPSRDTNGLPVNWNAIPKDVVLGQIVNDNGVQKFASLEFDGTSSTIGSLEEFDNLYTYNKANTNAHPYKRRLEYIESTGTQYINTGVSPDFTNGDEVEISFYKAEFTGSAPCVFGSRETPALNGFYAIGYGLVVADNSGYLSIAWNSPVGYYVMRVNDSVIQSNNDTYEMPKRVTCAYPMYLFALNSSDIMIVPYSGMKLYDWKYYQNGVLVQHLIPVLDNEDVPCLYDEVNNVFLYNAGTGTFNYGELPQLDVIELGEITAISGTQEFTKYSFDGVSATINSVEEFDDLYTYNIPIE